MLSMSDCKFILYVGKIYFDVPIYLWLNILTHTNFVQNYAKKHKEVNTPDIYLTICNQKKCWLGLLKTVYSQRWRATGQGQAASGGWAGEVDWAAWCQGSVPGRRAVRKYCKRHELQYGCIKYGRTRLWRKQWRNQLGRRGKRPYRAYLEMVGLYAPVHGFNECLYLCLCDHLPCCLISLQATQYTDNLKLNR